MSTDSYDPTRSESHAIRMSEAISPNFYRPGPMAWH